MTWETVPLGEVAALNPRARASSTSTTFLGMADLGEDGRTSQGTRVSVDELKPGYTPFKNRDLLVAKITPCFENGKIGQATIPTEDGWGSTEFHVVRPDESLIDPRYLLHFLRSPSVRANGEMRMTGSAGQKRVPLEFLRGLYVPLPPLPEQRRIAAILDEADALRSASRQRVSHIDELVRAHHHRVLASKPLSETLGSLLARIDSGISPVCESRTAQDGEWGVLKLGAITTGLYLPDENKAITADYQPQENLTVRAGDVLLSRKNTLEHVGASVFVDSTPPQRLLPDLIFRLVPLDPTIGRALQAFLALPATRRALSNLAGGSASSMANISKSRLMTLRAPALTPAVVAAIESYATGADHLRKEALVSVRRTDALFASLQHRAFRGEL